MTACSDGVTVDLAPPTPGCVQIAVPDYNEGLEFGSAVGGSDGDLLEDSVMCENVGGFQASNSELVLRWDNFTGVDTTYHITSITHYEYAVGKLITFPICAGDDYFRTFRGKFSQNNPINYE